MENKILFSENDEKKDIKVSVVTFVHNSTQCSKLRYKTVQKADSRQKFQVLYCADGHICHYNLCKKRAQVLAAEPEEQEKKIEQQNTNNTKNNILKINRNESKSTKQNNTNESNNHNSNEREQRTSNDSATIEKHQNISVLSIGRNGEGDYNADAHLCFRDKSSSLKIENDEERERYFELKHLHKEKMSQNENSNSFLNLKNLIKMRNREEEIKVVKAFVGNCEKCPNFCTKDDVVNGLPLIKYWCKKTNNSCIYAHCKYADEVAKGNFRSIESENCESAA